jgi:hypothetical protein
MSRQYWTETLNWATADGAAVANSTTETISYSNINIPANYLQDGRVFRLRVFFKYGTTATPTLQLRIRLGGVGGTVLAASGAVTTASAIGGGASMTAMGQIEMFLQVRSNGSSGTMMSNGVGSLFTTTAPTSGTVTNYEMGFPICSGSTGGSTPVAVTVDLTVDAALAFTATWGTANAANSIQGINYLLESMN